MKIIRVMDTVTVVLINGEIISSSECTDEMFLNIYNSHQDFKNKKLTIEQLLTKIETELSKNNLD